MIQATRHLEDHKSRPRPQPPAAALEKQALSSTALCAGRAPGRCGRDACYVAWEGMWRAEAGMDETPHYNRRVAIVFVDDFEVHTVAALRYARSLHPTTLRAVRRRPRPPRGGTAGRAGDCDLARAQLLTAAGQAAARAHGRQDRWRGEPGAQRRGHHHPVERRIRAVQAGSASRLTFAGWPMPRPPEGPPDYGP